MPIWKVPNAKIIFVDTGAFIGKYNSRDPHRLKVLPCFKSINENKLNLATSNAVIYETYTRIIHDTKGDINACLAFLDFVLEEKIIIFRVSKEDEKMAKEKIKEFSDKKKLTLVDALSSVLMNKNNIIKVFTLDERHFRSMNYLTIPPISNLTQFLSTKYY